MVVDNDAVCAAIMDIYNDTRAVVEPSGALAAAGLKQWAQGRRTKKGALAAIACGANMNFDRLRFVAERAELGEQREALFGATIPEKPGSFRRFCKLLGRRQITEFNYRFADSKEAHIFVGVEIDRAAERAEIVRTLRQGGIEAVDLSADEMAKLHIRHMVGGRARAADEILCRFEFPERPGALMHFLKPPRRRRRALEHQFVSLPQPRRRLRTSAGRSASAPPPSARASTRFWTDWAIATRAKATTPPTKCFCARPKTRARINRAALIWGKVYNLDCRPDWEIRMRDSLGAQAPTRSHSL